MKSVLIAAIYVVNVSMVIWYNISVGNFKSVTRWEFIFPNNKNEDNVFDEFVTSQSEIEDFVGVKQSLWKSATFNKRVNSFTLGRNILIRYRFDIKDCKKNDASMVNG